MKIGIYGGTFDPIHRGHMAAARAASGALGLDKLLIIPDGTPPHKAQDACGASGHHRLEMARIAADRLGLSIPVAFLLTLLLSIAVEMISARRPKTM